MRDKQRRNGGGDFYNCFGILTTFYDEMFVVAIFDLVHLKKN